MLGTSFSRSITRGTGDDTFGVIWLGLAKAAKDVGVDAYNGEMDWNDYKKVRQFFTTVSGAPNYAANVFERAYKQAADGDARETYLRAAEALGVDVKGWQE